MLWETEIRSRLARARTCLRLNQWLMVLLLPAVAVALYGAFLYAPTEKIMGEVQRIFYFHVSSAFASFASFFVVLVAGIAYLTSRRSFWDALGAASAEVGLLFTLVVMTTGPIWSKPAWNTWFAWGDPRIMTELVLMLIFVAYFVLRSTMPEGEQKYKYSAIFGILGALNVPLVFMSIRWWRTMHPVIITTTEIKLAPAMRDAALMALVACLLLLTVLILLRTAQRMHQQVTWELVHRWRELTQ